MLKQVEQWHNKWCDWLDDFIINAHDATLEFKKPTLEFSSRGGNVAGKYFPTRNVCRYYLPYPLMLGDRYEETVMHEVCHSAAHQIFPAAQWHGDFFHYLTRVVCGYPNHKTCHNHNVRIVKQYIKQAKLLLLQHQLLLLQGET